MASVGRESSFSRKALWNDISQALYEQKQKALFCDVIMRICGTEMSVHSAVLAAASPYFSTFLSQDLPRQFSQRSPQIIEIQVDTAGDTTDAYAQAVTALVDYIYTGVLNLKSSMVVQVWELARIMQLDTVLQFCDTFSSGKDMAQDPDQSTTVDAEAKHIPAKNDLVGLPRPGLGTTVSLGGKNAFVPPLPVGGPQKLLKAGKLVSTSTQVTPRLLGIKPPIPKETRDCRTQTQEKDFPEKVQRTYQRSGKKKHALLKSAVPGAETEAGNNSEIVMEIRRTKLKPTSVTVVKVQEEPPGAQQGDGAEIQLGDEATVQYHGGAHELSYDAENDEFLDMFITNGKRRSGRRPKPTPKIMALQRRGPVKFNPEGSPLEEEILQPTDVPDIEEPTKKSPRKSTIVVKEEPADEIFHEVADIVKEEPGNIDNHMPETELDGLMTTDSLMTLSPQKVIGSMSQVTQLNPAKKKAGIKMRRKKQLKKFSCSECNFQTNKVGEFTSHKRLHKMDSNICYYCDIKFNIKDELNEHFQKHKGPLPYFCPVCDGRYKSRTQLNIHLPKHSAHKPFVCEICSAGFKWKHALKNHMVVHSNRKDHLCDQCGYATAHKCQLKAHKLIHTGETYRCPFKDCRFQATKKQNLKYHILTHTREKPHQCEICGQSFSLIKNMRRHMLLHSTQKPHQCDQCDFSTTRFDKLKEHMLKLHGMGSPPEKRVRVADLVQDFTSLGSVVEPGELAQRLNVDDGEEPMALNEVTAPLVAATDDLIGVAAADALVGDPQTMQFMPGQTIIITQTAQDGQVQPHEVVPAGAQQLLAAGGGGGGDGGEEVQSAVQFTEVMIPVSQLSDYVQELNFVSQT